MSNPVPKYEIGQIVYLVIENMTNHFFYIEEHQIVAVTFSSPYSIEYKVGRLGYTRKEHEVITDRVKAEDECRRRIEEKYKRNLELLEKKENFEKLRT